MPDGERGIPRRTLLGVLAAASGGATAALGSDNGQGDLFGGTMALDKPYKAGDRLWIGPDSARSEVEAKSGRIYIGASGSGYTFYNGDSGAWDSKGLGDSSNPLSSIFTEELNNAARIQPSTPVSEINSELTTPGRTVVLDDGDHVLQDRIEFGAADTSVVVANGAMVTFADDANPTLYSDRKNNDQTILIFNDGYNGVTVRIKGVVDANDANHTNARGVWLKNSTHPTLDSRGGKITNAHGCAFLESCTYPEVPWLTGTEAAQAVLGMEYTDHLDAGVLRGIDTGETLDLNGENHHSNIDAVIAAGTSDGTNTSSNEVLDVNGSPHTKIGRVVAHSGVERIVKVAGGIGSDDKSDHLHIGEISGYCTDTVARLVSTGEGRDITIEGVDVVSENKGVIIEHGANNQWDNLTLKGRIRTVDGFKNVWNLGRSGDVGTYRSDGLTLDIEAVSAYGAAVNLFDVFDDISGRVKVQDCANDGLRINPGVTCDLTVNAYGNGDNGVEVSGSNCRLRGTVSGSTNADILVTADGTDVDVNMDYGTVTDNGTGTLINGKEVISGVSDAGSAAVNGGTPVDQVVSVRDVTNGHTATFLLANGSVTEIADPSANFGTASGSGNLHDIVWDGTNNQHVIENASGASADYEVDYGGVPA